MSFFSRQTLRPVSPRRRTARPRLEPLEGRQLLSGFGPEDGAYIVESRSGYYTDIKIQPTDQKIVAAGTFPGPGLAIARYDSVGNPDTSYGSGGLSTTTIGWAGTKAGLALQSDGKAVVASSQYGYFGSVFGAVRFNTNGSLDTRFGSGGFSGVNVGSFGQNANGVGLQSNDKIVVGGYTSESHDTFKKSGVLARFKASGALDSGTGGFGNVVKGKASGYTKDDFGAITTAFEDIAIQQVDDKVVAVGHSGPHTAAGQLIVARYTAAGIPDTTFNGRGYSVLTLPGISYTSANIGSGLSVALQSDGKIVAVSTCSGVDGSSDMLIVRYNTDGRLDTSFGGGSGYVRLDIDGTVSHTMERGSGVTIQPDGKIVAVGSLTTVTPQGGTPANVLVARLNADGTPDSTFGSGGFKIGAVPTGDGYHSFKANGVALQSDGSIIVAGTDNWDTTSSNQHPFLMRFFGSQPRALQAADGAAPAPSHAIPLTQAQVRPLLTQAIALWQARGADTSRLGHVDVVIADLGGATLGLASGHTITLDDNAAGWGWLVGHSSRRGRKAPSGRMDLLSALTHEVGHLLGHEHDEGGVMAETLAPGVGQADDDQGLVAVPESGHDHPLAAIPQASSRLSLRAFRGRGRRPRFASRG